MRKSAILLFLVFLAACACADKKPDLNFPPGTEYHVLTGTTVSTINKVDISVGNIYDRKRGDGSEGISIGLRMKDVHHTLFLGDEIDIGDQLWRVHQLIESNDTKPGAGGTAVMVRVK